MIIALSIVAILGMMGLTIFYPTLHVKNFKFNTFYLPLLLVAVIFLAFPLFDKTELFESLFTDTPINPLKILVLFLSISVLSIALDLSGFFVFLSSWAIRRFHNSQYALFFSLFVLVSLTTIFTSNDIVILTFTPFIIYLARHGKISATPYLVMEFVAGNTFSMLLEIGNPTNIYLSTAFGISFVDYVKVMAIPTLIIGLFSIGALLLLFRKRLSKPIEHFDLETKKIEDPFLMWVSLIHLVSTIVCLALSNFLHFEMWIITLVFAASLTTILFVYSFVAKKHEVRMVYKRLPYSLAPFIISMFIIIMAVDSTGVFQQVGSLMGSINNDVLQGISYLLSSTIMCNLVNNIPMSLMFSRILDGGSVVSVYSTIIGSNLGALLSPIGALAGIMWMSILKEKGVNFSFGRFMKYGAKITGIMLVGAFIGVALLPLFI